MLKKLKWWPFAALLWFPIEGCAPKPPNVFVFEYLHQQVTTDPVTKHTMLTPSPACMEKIHEAECGHGVAIVSGDEIFVGEEKLHWWNGKPWSKVVRESAFLPAEESYAPLARYVIDACKKMKCSDDVTRFKIKLDSLNGIKGALEN